MPEEDAVESDDGTDVNGDEEGIGEGPLARIEAMDTERWAEAVVTGAITYVVGYLIMAAFFLVGPANPGESLSRMEQLSKVGVTFNAAHHVDVTSSEYVLVVADGQATELGTSFSLFRLSELLGAEQAIPTSVYVGLPIILLVTVGFSRAWRLTPTEDVWDPVKTTLGFPLGYGAVAYLGAFLFSYPIGKFTSVTDIALVATRGAIGSLQTQENVTSVWANTSNGFRKVVEIQGQVQTEPTAVTLAPDSTWALLTGIAYPLAFATLGALAAISIRQKIGESDGNAETNDE